MTAERTSSAALVFAGLAMLLNVAAIAWQWQMRHPDPPPAHVPTEMVYVVEFSDGAVEVRNDCSTLCITLEPGDLRRRMAAGLLSDTQCGAWLAAEDWAGLILCPGGAYLMRGGGTRATEDQDNG